jgi:hypothetical protein
MCCADGSSAPSECATATEQHQLRPQVSSRLRPLEDQDVTVLLLHRLLEPNPAQLEALVAELVDRVSNAGRFQLLLVPTHETAGQHTSCSPTAAWRCRTTTTPSACAGDCRTSRANICSQRPRKVPLCDRTVSGVSVLDNNVRERWIGCPRGALPLMLRLLARPVRWFRRPLSHTPLYVFQPSFPG